jgi:hypothetical protein
MAFQSINPANGDVLATYEETRPEDVRMPHSCGGGAPTLMIALGSCGKQRKSCARIRANMRV